MTSVIATVFTAPFVIAHFGALPLLGVVGNLILLPVFSFAIMPLVILGMFGMTFAVDWAHVIYEWLLGIAHVISDVPCAVLHMPHISNISIVFITLGLACLMFVRPVRIKINYVMCSVLVLLGLGIYGFASRPVFFASSDNELVAFMTSESNLVFSKSRSSSHYFAFDTWKQMVGIDSATPTAKHKCHRSVCDFKNASLHIVQTTKFMPLQKHLVEWCNDKDIDYVVSYFEIDMPSCTDKILPRGSVVYENGHVRQTPTNRYWHNPH
jgi:competence protein ComEC